MVKGDSVADLLRGGIAINEILVDPNGATSFDTDGNGISAATDEYIELVNVSSAAISIAGLQLWDKGTGQWFTFPPGSVLQPGAHAMVMTGLQPGGSLPTGASGDLFFEAGRSTALINNGGDNVIVYDPIANQYISARFNGVPLDKPTLGGGGYTGFPSTATLVGMGENFGRDIDGYSIQRAPDGSNTFVNNRTPTPGTSNVCFVAGTHMQTPAGNVLVEALRPGDVLVTRDHGPQRVLWVWAKTQTVAAMAQNPQLRPVRIARHALGAGLPQRDIYLSQQHRVLVASPIAHRVFDTQEVLIAAKDLCGLHGVAVEQPTRDITYIHLLFATHEVIFAEGTPAESLFLGPQALRSLDGPALAELHLLLGVDLTTTPSADHSPVRLFAAGNKAREMVARHAKHQRPLYAYPVPA